jgi:hypothetical protein
VYVAADETLAAVAWGVARTALPDTDLPFQTDTTSALQVRHLLVDRRLSERHRRS